MDGDGKQAHAAERSLVSIAMLKVRYDLKQQDFLDYLRPYVSHVLPPKGERVQSADVAFAIKREFGLSIPIQVLERLLSRLHKQKALTKVDGALYVDKITTDPDLEQRRAKAAADIASVINGFKTHCKERFDRTPSDDDAVLTLSAFIGKFSVECLRSFMMSSTLPSVPSTGTTDVLAASFINQAAQAGGQAWEEIKTLFKSVLLANAFTSPDVDLATSKFRGLSFYFDTQLILALLGLHGEYDQKKTTELIKQIKGLEGSCFVFEHTIDETRAVLKYAETNLDSSEHTNRAIRQLRQDGKKRSDVVMLATKVEEDLKLFGVRTRATPKYDERYQIDESALEWCLDEDIGHMNEKALLHDINSVRSIYVLRSGTAPRKIEDAKAIFVTANFGFAKAADNFSRKYEISREVSPVVSDFSLANICWLKRPAQADDLITLELLASTEAALSPSSSEWQACLDECEKLRKQGRISQDQEALVRESLVAQDDYVTLTKGTGNSFGPEIALELIRRAEERIAEPLRRTVDQAQAQTLKAIADLDTQTRSITAVDGIRAQRVDRSANALACVVGFIVGALLLYGTWLGINAAIEGTSVGALSTWKTLVATGVPLLTVLLGWFGWGQRQLQSKLSMWISKKLKAQLLIG